MTLFALILNTMRFLKANADSLAGGHLLLALLIILLINLDSAGQSIRVDNTSEYLQNATFSWKVFIQSDSETLRQVECVEYLLDPSYTQPRRKVCKLGDTRYPFALSGEALKPFKIGVMVYFQNKPPAPLLEHTLKLTREIAVTPQIRIRQNTTKILEQSQFQKQVAIAVNGIFAKKRDKPFKIRIFETSSQKPLFEAELPSGYVNVNFSYSGQEYVLRGYTKAIALGFDYLYCTVYKEASR